MNNLQQVYSNKKVLITGHTGFKGAWLAIWLNQLGAQVIGYALEPDSNLALFELSRLKEKIIDIRGDIRDSSHLKSVFETYKPDFVFHLAAQPLVRCSYEQPILTYETNVMGTINVLECIRNLTSSCTGVFITTDKCYENREQPWGYRENDALGGYDPYSSSKAVAEIAIQSWRRSFMSMDTNHLHHKAIATARAGNVIGGGDWAKDRIVPDCIRALEKEEEIQVRNPRAIRPWQYVLEPLYGYLKLGEKLNENPSDYSEAWNFGPSIESIIPVGDLVQQIIEAYGKGKMCIVKEEQVCHEANLLNLDISKSVFKLKWRPTLSIHEAIRDTVDWYQRYIYEDCYELCIKQIDAFIKHIKM